MRTYIIVAVASGILFGVLDGVLNANPLAQRMFEVFKPIARTSVNMPVGLVIDLAYGFLMAGIFVILYASLPGSTGLIKGLSFGAMAWFFRVVMSAASQWMMFRVPLRTVAYSLAAGLVEMLVIGVLFGLTLKPWK